MKQSDVLFILSNGKVGAISKWDGTILWEKKMKDYLGKSVSGSIGQLAVENDKLYIGLAGYLICLATTDGSLIWKNELKGWGFNFISMANVNSDASAAATAQMHAAATTVMVASTV